MPKICVLRIKIEFIEKKKKKTKHLIRISSENDKNTFFFFFFYNRLVIIAYRIISVCLYKENKKFMFSRDIGRDYG